MHHSADDPCCLTLLHMERDAIEKPSGTRCKQPSSTVAGGDGRLKVAPPQFVPATEEQRAAVLRALRVLYLDFIAAGGLEELRQRRAETRESG